MIGPELCIEKRREGDHLEPGEGRKKEAKRRGGNTHSSVRLNTLDAPSVIEERNDAFV